MATTPRSTTTGRGGPGTGSFKEKGGKGGGKGGMRKLMLVERTDTKRGRGGGRGRRGTEMSEVSIDATDSISVRGLPTHGSGSGSPSALTPGVVGGGMNRSEQHLSYFHFDSTETLVQSKQSMLGWWLEGLGVLGGLLCIVGMFPFFYFPSFSSSPSSFSYHPPVFIEYQTHKSCKNANSPITRQEAS